MKGGNAPWLPGQVVNGLCPDAEKLSARLAAAAAPRASKADKAWSSVHRSIDGVSLSSLASHAPLGLTYKVEEECSRLRVWMLADQCGKLTSFHDRNWCVEALRVAVASPRSFSVSSGTGFLSSGSSFFSFGLPSFIF